MDTSIFKNKKVVIIEDNKLLSEIISRKLEQVGAVVFAYHNGLEGLAGIRYEQPDLVLLDIMLPVMNGYEVLEVMKNESLIEKHPVIVVSNSGQPVEINRLLELGAKDYLIKVDFTPEEVLQKSAMLLLGEKVSTPTLVPVSEPEPVPAAQADDVIRVFVVEDDPMLRNMLATKFSKSHCASMFTNDGIQAVDLAVQYEPDVILLDLMLPGKDGFEILEDVKAKNALPGIPIIVFSNKSEPENKKRVMELGASAYHVKALTDLNELVSEIRAFKAKHS